MNNNDRYDNKRITPKSREFTKHGNDKKKDDSFKFKNSLIITPHYEVEFNTSGGVRYIRNGNNEVLLLQDGVFITYNNIIKMPVLEKREINKLSSQKKLVIREKYNFEDMFNIHQDIILYYNENRIDFETVMNKVTKSADIKKDIRYEFSSQFTAPEIDGIVRYTSDGKDDIKKAVLSTGKLVFHDINWVDIECEGASRIVLYPETELRVCLNNKSLTLVNFNVDDGKSCINYIFYFKEKPFNSQ